MFLRLWSAPDCSKSGVLNLPDFKKLTGLTMILRHVVLFSEQLLLKLIFPGGFFGSNYNTGFLQKKAGR